MATRRPADGARRRPTVSRRWREWSSMASASCRQPLCTSGLGVVLRCHDASSPYRVFEQGIRAPDQETEQPSRASWRETDPIPIRRSQSSDMYGPPHATATGTRSAPVGPGRRALKFDAPSQSAASQTRRPVGTQRGQQTLGGMERVAMGPWLRVERSERERTKNHFRLNSANRSSYYLLTPNTTNSARKLIWLC